MILLISASDVAGMTATHQCTQVTVEIGIANVLLGVGLKLQTSRSQPPK
jgi:hypothetical protein